VLLFNETPEDVTVFREQVTCPVLATTFDMAPENHLKLTDMVLEQAQRMVELKRDVVLLVDSLTTLTKVASTAALQQGRVVPGMINPASLHKAKRLFGAARCLREGGSLTVIATMNMDNGNKVDDSVVNEFRAAANMELVLDQTLAKAGVYPPIALAHSGTRKAEAILTPAHMEGIKLIRGILSTMPAANAVQELKSMMEKAPTNEDLLVRIKDWIAAIQA
jgi:transcription termination factor Rho